MEKVTDWQVLGRRMATEVPYRHSARQELVFPAQTPDHLSSIAGIGQDQYDNRSCLMPAGLGSGLVPHNAMRLAVLGENSGNSLV